MKYFCLFATIVLLTLGSNRLEANSVPFCAPVSISFKFPNEKLSQTEQFLNIVFQNETTCLEQDSSAMNLIPKQMFFSYGEQRIDFPARCVPRKPIDLSTFLIEQDEAFSVRFRLIGEESTVAVYYLSGQFVCRQSE